MQHLSDDTLLPAMPAPTNAWPALPACLPVGRLLVPAIVLTAMAMAVDLLGLDLRLAAGC
ncbi:MAG: hypothetical protein ACR2J7_10760 [Luteimonas sp.]